ncbi:MAG: hypothetical protein Q7J20_02370 [Candidatus Nitrotoga sp.]|nr:hypothetical protein [Candidatus Nitrotoga sp.]MDO9446751.1 hypothetical protein [Candidatus Nitrotoga sp.]MDP3497099.1 hypothetical protein [Candidatus Nitrotoga sp.]
MISYLKKEWLLTVMVTLSVVVIAGGATRFVWPQIQMAMASPVCEARGSVDTPKIIDTTGQASINIEGWAADAAGVSHVEMWANGKLLATVKPSIARADVASVFPQCKFPTVSGYAFALARGIIPPHTSALEVRAVNGGGRVFNAGRVSVNFLKPFGMLDVTEPIKADGRNLISGWVVAGQVPVKVRVLAQDKEMLVLLASNQRDDVAKIFPAWPQAATSGFEGVLPMHKLPRGNYRLRILFEDGKGHNSEIVGPQVINDLPFGKVLAQHDKMMSPGTIELRAWLADEQGIRAAYAETEMGAPLGKMTLTKNGQLLSAFLDPRFNRDKAGDAPLRTGDLYGLNVPSAGIPSGLQRLQVRVEDNAGNTAVLPGPLVLDKNPATRQVCSGEKLRVFYPGGAVDFRDNFRQLQELRDMAQGGCVEIGFRGRVEYMRTTKGKQADYIFDSNFPERLRSRNGKGMSGESLSELLDTALRFRAPLMITLDGGVWADSKFAAPDLDIVDMLEQDERAVQWNQFGKSEPDDALKSLAGATDSPELARMMSLNHYNRRFLDYKKRNLQAAVREIVKFNQTHPASYVMINLDPDEYINPWFYQTQWYDYNPDTLRQYREWLLHLGPYANGGELAFSRHEPGLTLADVNRLAKQSWKDVSAIEPPRKSIDYGDQWQQLWTQFRRHLVARHYDDLAAWVVEAGLPPARIYTSQTFIQADVAVSITDRANGWNDQAGVSIEGAKPRQGHLGVILYGPGSRNEGKPRSGSSLIDNIRRTDPEWGVVEFHPATIAFPEKLPDHTESYATMQALINGGAHFLSPMWGSYVGDRMVHPNNFKAYDVMEGSAYEYQFVWWLRAMQAWPVGSLFYPFGNALVKSNDGWTPAAETHLISSYGELHLTGEGARIGLVSPQWETRYLTAPTELVITGSWPQQTRASAVLLLENGEKLSCSLRSIGQNRVRCLFPAAQKRQMSRLTLEWQLPAAQQKAGVKISDVAFKLAEHR